MRSFCGITYTHRIRIKENENEEEEAKVAKVFPCSERQNSRLYFSSHFPIIQKEETGRLACTYVYNITYI